MPSCCPSRIKFRDASFPLTFLNRARIMLGVAVSIFCRLSFNFFRLSITFEVPFDVKSCQWSPASSIRPVLMRVGFHGKVGIRFQENFRPTQGFSIFSIFDRLESKGTVYSRGYLLFPVLDMGHGSPNTFLFVKCLKTYHFAILLAYAWHNLVLRGFWIMLALCLA